MAGSGFDRTIINPRERPISSDINSAQSTLDRTLRDYCLELFATGTPQSGFVGGSFRVWPTASPSNTVTIAKGVGFYHDASSVVSSIDSVSGLDDRSPYKPLYLSADQSILIDPGDAVNPRIDIIEVKVDRRTTDASDRDVFNGTVFVQSSVKKTLSFDLLGRNARVVSPNPSTTGISYKVGLPAAVPVEPAVTPGYMKIARINMPPVLTTVAANQIVDYRPYLSPHGYVPFSARAYTTTTGGAALLSANVPPGWQTSILTLAASPRFRWYIVPGGSAAGGAFTSGMLAASAAPEYGATGNPPTEFEFAQIVGISETLLMTAGIQTIVAGASPPLAVAVGQPYCTVDVQPVRQAGGTTGNIVGIGNHFYCLSGSLRYGV